MINQNTEEFKRWMEFQSTNPPKITGCLERFEHGHLLGRCCLGNACHINIPEKRIPNTHGLVSYGEKGGYAILPESLAKVLNITETGLLTKLGSRFVSIWLRENNVKNATEDYSWCQLTHINDSISADHTTIGQLIEHLAFIEREHGIECFVPLF